MPAPEPASPSERWLAGFLRLSGAVMVLAFLAVLMPTSWMAASNAWLGLDTFPASPLVDYLTRTNSLLYGMHGGLLLVVAADVRRYARVIFYLAWIHVLFGAAVLLVDIVAGMPAYWAALEGPPVIAAGVLTWVLVRRVGRPAARSARVRPAPSRATASAGGLADGLPARSTAAEN